MEEFEKFPIFLPPPMRKLEFVKLRGVGGQWREDYGGLWGSKDCEGELNLGCGNLADGVLSFFKGHEKVLKERSGFVESALKMMEKENEEIKPVIHFEKISAVNMQRLLNFLYVGYVTLERGEVEGFMEGARELGVTGIMAEGYGFEVPTHYLGEGEEGGEGLGGKKDGSGNGWENFDMERYAGEALISRGIPWGDEVEEAGEEEEEDEVDTSFREMVDHEEDDII